MQIGAIQQRSDMTDDLVFGVGINAAGRSAGCDETAARARRASNSWPERWDATI